MDETAKKTIGWSAVLAAITVLGLVIGIVADVIQIGGGGERQPEITVQPPPAAPVNVTQQSPTPAYGRIFVPSDYTDVYSWDAPNFNSTARYSLQQDFTVEIICTTQGQTIYNGTLQLESGLWNYTAYGYIPDVFMDTGSVQARKPPC